MSRYNGERMYVLSKGAHVLDFLYALFVKPVELVIELAFSLSYSLLQNPGLSIIAVSLVVNAICTPLYAMADAKQSEERERQARMERWVSHIKKTFTGDERYMMLNTYYDEQGYKQWYALGSSVSLLLQIPIFMAAYNYLSNLALLRGASFMGIENLGVADSLLVVGGTTIHVLPIVMTVLNIVSTAIYTRGLPLKDKVQPYALAALFLVLLYNSPSGLVLYWTCNQVFSLVRNIVTKLVPDLLHRYGKWAAEALVLGASAYLIATHRVSEPKQWALLLAVVLLASYLLLRPRAKREPSPAWSPKRTTALFLICGLLLSVLAGLLIPSALMSTSPTEFISVNTGDTNPLRDVAYAFEMSFGMFVIWGGVFFALSDARGRQTISQLYLALSLASLVDYLVVLKPLGDIDVSLAYDEVPQYTHAQQAISVGLVLIAAAASYLLWKFLPNIVLPAVGILVAALLVMSGSNIFIIANAEREAVSNAQESTTDKQFFDEDGNPVPLFKLSKTGKNVVVLFMDRAVSSLMPYILNEKPELAQKLQGFTYYPNTLSYGGHTVFASSAVYGGYEYTPTKMNERSDETLPNKHNESLLVLPTLLANKGFDVTLLDAPQVNNYPTSPEFPQADAIEGVTYYDVAGAYTDHAFPELAERDAQQFSRNLVYYSLFHMSPACVRTRIYDKAHYLDPNSVTTKDEKGTVRTSVKDKFLRWYSALASLADMTQITDDASNNLMMMDNETPHNPSILTLPNYEVPLNGTETVRVDYSLYTIGGQKLNVQNDNGLGHYHANMATIQALADWFDYLREEGVYDNTRIIVVSDHGTEYQMLDNLVMRGFRDGKDLNIELFNPLFMVKDFNATGDLKTSNEFMTNADTPTIVLDGIVSDPVNPFTGNKINTDDKNASEQVLTISRLHSPNKYQQGNVFDTSDAGWASVHDNIFDPNNWSYLGK